MVLINGLTCYERNVKESKATGGRALHQPESQSRDSRSRKKVTSKTDWYKPKKTTQENGIIQPDGGCGSHASRRYDGDGECTPGTEQADMKHGSSDAKLRVTSVFFVEPTPGGKLASSMREAEKEAEV
jgi:hypothetical protein